MCRLEVRWMRAGQGCAKEDERADLAMEMSSLSSSTSWRVATTVSGMMASSALTWRSASLNLPSVTLRYIPFNRSSSVLSVYGCTGEKILVQAPRCLRLGSVQAVRLVRMSHVITSGTSGARDTHQCWGAGGFALVSAACMLKGHGHDGRAGQRGHHCQRARVDLQEERLQRLKIADPQLPAGHGWSDAEDALALRKALMQQLTGYSLT